MELNRVSLYLRDFLISAVAQRREKKSKNSIDIEIIEIDVDDVQNSTKHKHKIKMRLCSCMKTSYAAQHKINPRQEITFFVIYI